MFFPITDGKQVFRRRGLRYIVRTGGQDRRSKVWDLNANTPWAAQKDVWSEVKVQGGGQSVLVEHSFAAARVGKSQYVDCLVHVTDCSLDNNFSLK